MIFLNELPVDLSARFPDGTFAFRLKGQLLTSALNCVGISKAAVLRWHYSDESEMSAVFYIVNHLRDIGVEHINLMLPYIPNARMDRVKSHSEVFTLKFFARFINSLNFANVIVLDPHSNVAPALINRVCIRQPKLYIRRAISGIAREGLIAYYPDEGAVKRYADMSDLPFIYGEKKRDWVTGKITGLHVVTDNVEDITEHPILMIDDICSHGGTFYYSALALKELGAGDIYIYCSHCENSIFEGKLLKQDDFIKHIYTTDSIFTKEEGHSDKFTVFHCA